MNFSKFIGLKEKFPEIFDKIIKGDYEEEKIIEIRSGVIKECEEDWKCDCGACECVWEDIYFIDWISLEDNSIINEKDIETIKTILEYQESTFIAIVENGEIKKIL